MKLILEPHEMAKLMVALTPKPQTRIETVHRDTDATLDRLCATEADLAYYRAALEKCARLLNIPLVSGDFVPLHQRVVGALTALLTQINKESA